MQRGKSISACKELRQGKGLRYPAKGDPGVENGVILIAEGR